MAERVKVGDIITVPLKLQLIKCVGHNDTIYHVAIPVDNPKRLVYLKGPYFMACTDPYPDSKLEDMDMGMLQNAVAYLQNRLGNFRQEDESEDGDEEEEGTEDKE